MKAIASISAAATVCVAMLISLPVSSADIPALPAEMNQDGVRYLTGGVGEESATAFKQLSPKYPLELLFAQKASPGDVYLSGVKVTIRQSGKVMLDVEADGPFLLAQLPPGRYQIEAISDGVLKRQAVQIAPGKHQRVVFVWDDPGQPVN